jgi:bacillolysin
MTGEFQSFHYHVADEIESDEREPVLRGVRGLAEGDPGVDTSFTNDEAAARFHLNTLLGERDQPALRGITAPDSAELVPNLQLIDTIEIPQTETRIVRFEQTHAAVPVFGARAICELTQDRGLVSADAQIGDVGDVSPVASLSPAEALQSIARLAGVESADLGAPAPQLNYFRHPETEDWHLVYVFHDVPAAPPELADSAEGHGLGASPRDLEPLVDYLVDAHTGTVVYYYSAQPMLDVPTLLKGFGEGMEGAVVEFWGRKLPGAFEMKDPLRLVATFDLKLGDIRGPVPSDAVRSSDADLADTNRAAVSAHVNATKVYNFYKSVLLRDGVDDKGMELFNMVNCTYGLHQPPPTWRNAVWYKDRMWYGQAADQNGRLVSYSRFLDVIAHELTHGVTKYTAGLVYKNQSGALNESFSDIIGIIVKNWDWSREDGGDVAMWDWELGAGLGPNGLPLRDLSDPARTGDPDHMSKYLKTTADSGGVHTNSNIHNKAAYNLLTTTDESSKPVFTPREVSYLYYLTLTRLSPLANFADILRGMIDVARTYYAGNEAERNRRVQTITGAYAAVGINT